MTTTPAFPASRPLVTPTPDESLVQRIEDALPQTQCTRCGYPDCHAYAQAIAQGQAGIHQCPPGGQEGVARLARLTGLPVRPLDPAHGVEGPRAVAVIDETWCIGCTLCLKACPVDCIVGANKRMHTVVEAQCTGCALCIPVCPVSCIAMEPVSGDRTGWAAWSEDQAHEARARYAFHQMRVARDKREHDEALLAKAVHKLSDLENQTRHTDPAVIARKRSVIEAAIARARALREPRESLPTDDSGAP